MRCSIRTDRVDFLEPNPGRTGGGPSFSGVDVPFSLLSSGSSAPVFTTGDAGIVLRRFFSPSAPVPTVLEEAEAKGRARLVVVVAGVRAIVGPVATFLAPTGLLLICRADVVEVCRVVRRAGVAGMDFVAGVRSEDVVGANDILLGLADMPSLVFSLSGGFSSTVPSEPLFLWVAVEGVDVVAGGLRTVEVEVLILGLAGGLLNELPRIGLAAEEVVVGREEVDSRGAAVLVAGLVAGWVLALTVVGSSFLSMIAVRRCAFAVSEDA